MRLIIRILAAPVSGVLSLAVAFLTFVLAISGAILGIVSVIVFILAVIMFTVPNVPGAIAWMAVAFLISPLGLPKLADWLVDKVDDVNGALKDFIMGY